MKHNYLKNKFTGLNWLSKLMLTCFAVVAFGATSIAQVTGYTFTEDVEVYTAVVGTNSTATGDDGVQDNISMPFPFIFDGVSVTSFSISTNGFIRLNTAVGGTHWTNSLANAAAQRPLIAPLWDDNNRKVTGAITYATLGVAPNRTLEVGWDAVSIGGGGSTTGNASFKIRLFETTNNIEFIYGPTLTTGGTLSASIGLNGQSTFLSVTPLAVSTFSTATANNAISATADLVGKKYTFTAPCFPVNVPYFLDFEGQLTCVTSSDENADANTWDVFTTGDLTGGGYDMSSYTTGSFGVYQYNTDGTTDADDWLFTKPLNLTAGTSYTLSYKYGAYNDGTNVYPESMDVFYGTSNDVASMTNSLASHPNINAYYNTNSVMFVPSVTGVYNIGFHANSTANQYVLILDDINVDLSFPPCVTPAGLTAYNATTTSAVLSWTGAVPTNWQVEYGVAPYTFTGTPTLTLTTNPSTLTGLAAGTAYQIRIRSNCSGTPSSWSTTVNFATACATVASFPFVEGFEAVTLPTCWTQEYVAAPNTNWATVVTNGNSTITPRTGARMAEFRVGNYTSVSKLITPPLNLTSLASPQLKFYYANVQWSPDIDDLGIYYKTSAAGTWTQIGATITTENTSWTQYSVTLPNPSSTYYIAIQGESDWAYGLNIDDFEVSESPTLDIRADQFTSPADAGCYGASEPVTVVVQNNTATPINLATNNLVLTANVAGAVTTTLTSTISTGTIAANAFATYTIGTLNMSTVGIYSFTGNAFIATETPVSNNTFPQVERAKYLTVTAPYSEGFETAVDGAAPTDWSGDGGKWEVANNQGVGGSKAFICNPYASNVQSTTYSLFNIGPVNAASSFTVSYRMVDWFSLPGAATTATTLTVEDYAYIGISTDCGNTFDILYTIDDVTHTPALSYTTLTFPLASYAGQNVLLAFQGNTSATTTNDFYFMIDDINVVKPVSNVSSLSNLTVSQGTLAPAFVSGTLNYTVTLPFGSTGGATLLATTTNTAATTSITSVANVAGTSPSNIGRVVVTAEDGITTSTYTVTYSIAPANTNSSLSALTTSVGTLSPVFASGTLNYTVNLPFGSTGGATVTPTRATTLSTITSNTGASNVAGVSPANVATVVVTAQSGATSTYTVTYVVAPANTNSSLSALTTSVGTLSPVFASGTFNYTVNLLFGSTGAATVTPTRATTLSTITSNTGASNVAGVSPANVATVVVRAQSGSTSTYTVTYVVAAPNTNSSLSALTSSQGTLSPAFAAGTFNYTVTLPTGSTGTGVLTPTLATTLSTVTANVTATDVIGAAPADVAYVVVTAQSGATSTYTVTYNVTVVVSNDAQLNNLTSSVGSLSPSFISSTTSYAVTLPFGTTGGATLVPTLNNGSQTTVITSATNVGGTSPANTATVVVTAADGTTTSTYTVVYSVTPANTNSSLSNLTSSVGTLAPAFASGTFNYTVSLPFGSTGAATLTPTLSSTLSTVSSNTSATNVAGTAGANVASVVVTAQNGSTSTYTVTYSVAAGNSNSSLSNLTTDVGSLSPAFAPATLNYTVNLPFGTTGAANLTPTLFTTLSTVTSNTSATNVAGTAGANVARVVVTAQSGATSTYTVTYVVAPASNNAALSNLVSDAGGSLSPVFASGTFNYTVTLPSGTTGGTTVTPTLADVNATVTSNTGAVDVNGSAPNNVATVIVTAENGTTTSTYTVTFNVAAAIANDATLNSITPSSGTLSPTFVSSITNYTVTLPFGSTGSETASVITNNAGATVNIFTASDVTAPAPANTVTIVVTAQDGITSLTYTVAYNITPASTDASLSNLTTDRGALSPAFANGTFNYTVTLPVGSTGAANLTPTLSTTFATVTTNTSASNVAGGAGTNVATVVVTAQNGATATYTVTYSVASSISTDARLSGLTTSVGSLNPTFVSSTTAYTVVLPFGSTGGASVTPTVNYPLAAVTSITSATNVAGSAGANVATVVVAAEDGTTMMTYTVTYSVAAGNSDATLSNLTSSQGALSPAFAAGTFAYTVTLPAGSTGTGVLTPTLATTLSTVSSNVSATDVAGSAPANTATIVVTAQNGATATYTVVYSVSTGIDELANTTKVEVYPNPTHGMATVKVTDVTSTKVKVSVVSLAGQVITETEIVNNGLELNHEIDLSKQPKGVYFVKVTGANNTVTKRVITF